MYKKQISWDDRIFSFFHGIEKKIKLPRFARAKDFDTVVNIYNSLPVDLMEDRDIAAIMIAKTGSENILDLFPLFPKELRWNADIIKLFMEKIPVEKIDPEAVLDNLKAAAQVEKTPMEEERSLVPILRFLAMLSLNARSNPAVIKAFAEKIPAELVVPFFKTLPRHMRYEPDITMLFVQIIEPAYVKDLFPELLQCFRQDVNIVKILVEKLSSSEEVNALFKMVLNSNHNSNMSADIIRLFIKNGNVVSLFNTLG